MKKIFSIIFLILFLLHSPVVNAQENTLSKLNIPSERVSSISSSDFGLIAGEYDTRIWNNPYNGILISYDKGQNWTKPALFGRGVTDVTYYNKQIYAATYYMVEGQNGLFKTSPDGLDFAHVGPNYSASKVAVLGSKIFLGTYSHGLWISGDNGTTWVQNIQTGGAYSTVIALEVKNNLVIVSTDNNTYISNDAGENFEQKNILNGKKISNILISNNVVIAASSNLNGIYRSTDSGSGFVKVNNWGNNIAGALTEFNNVFYISKLHMDDNKYYLYKSSDLGITWENTNIFLTQNIIDASIIFSLPASLYLVCSASGVFEYVVEQNQINYFPYFSFPLSSLSPDNFLSKITSYFDHEYPLLGYLYYQEPIYSADTTYNFYGNKKNTNTLFYSSHNGTDFTASYGENAYAVASGYATYYFCTDCGHSIKINHQNGYQTTYMHLQSQGLVAGSSPVWVDKNQIIGKVGLSGRTTGPHLHFQLQKDKDNNGFFDDFPEGNVDPFGWLNEYLLDPWEYYRWGDALGNHSGSASYYLWEVFPSKTSKYIQANDDRINLNTKVLTFDLSDTDDKFTAILSDFISPYIPLEQVQLKYVEGTSFSINLYNHLEENVINLDNDLTITINLEDLNLEKFSTESLKLYFYDELEQLWKPLPTIIDLVNNVLEAKTNHLSYFAVLGETLYPDAPQTSLTILGDTTNGYYISYPQITLSAQDNSGLGIARTLYSTDGGINWDEYTSPIILGEDGVVDFLYKSIDNASNVEETKNQVIKINTKGYWTKQIKIKSSNFTT